MLVLTSWLKEFVDFEVSVEELAEALTISGLEVEGLEPAYPWLSTVVAARVDELRLHPGREDIKVCRVTADGRQRQVVCGAPNVEQGMMTVLALPGTRLPEHGEVEEASLHGIQSSGMLCSEAELLLGEDASGIMALGRECVPGTPLAEILGIDDWVLEIGVTPNRADCLSILGVAREVAAIYRLALREPGRLQGPCPEGEGCIPIIIEAPELCGRYAGAVLHGVQVAPSPVRTRHRLISSGIRPINNIVDITNLVLLERGQPLHAFDLDMLHGPRIRVRTAFQGESIVTLDGKTRELSRDMLVIADQDRPVAVAGVMGGAETEVTDKTTRVLLESAWFAPYQVRRTSKALKLPSESSYRFERGVDPEGTVKALNRAVELMGMLCPRLECKGVRDVYPAPPRPRSIRVRPWRVNKILGTSLSGREIADLVQRIGFDIRSRDEGEIRGTPPSYRMDLFEEIDLIEEVARLHGFSNVPTESPVAAIDAVAPDDFERLSRRLKELLFAQGLTEVISYSFLSQREIDALGFPGKDKRSRAVRLANPLSDDQAVLRTSLLASLLSTVARNQARRHMNLRLFELGTVFFDRGEGSLPDEEHRVAALWRGLRHPGGWAWPEENADLFDLKGVLEEILAGANVEDWRFELGTPDDPYYVPGTSVRVIAGERPLGTLGQVDPGVAGAFGVKGGVFAFDLSFEALLACSTREKRFRPLPRYPRAERDAAIIVSEDVPSIEMVTLVRSQEVPILEGVEIFDVYSGKPIPRGYKSVGLRFRYRAPDHTLSDDEVASVHGPLVDLILKRFKARLRDS